jgi:hypothetical protein
MPNIDTVATGQRDRRRPLASREPRRKQPMRYRALRWRSPSAWALEVLG